jgi:predicted XRE-type DNA-binding protein
MRIDIEGEKLVSEIERIRQLTGLSQKQVSELLLNYALRIPVCKYYTDGKCQIFGEEKPQCLFCKLR